MLTVWEYITRAGESVTLRGLAQAVKEQVEDNSLSDENVNELYQEIVEDLVVLAIEPMGIKDEVKEAYCRKQKAIRARAARSWLAKLAFYWEKFLKRLQELSPYLVEFDLEMKIKDKTYPEDCIIEGLNPPIILISHDESRLSYDDVSSRVWKKANSNILLAKGRDRGMMIADFMFPSCRLTADGLLLEMRQQIGLEDHASLLFEFGIQNHQGYWLTEDVINHTLNSVIKILEVVYPGYQGLFLYDITSSRSSFADDALSRSSFADDALCIQNMNLSSGGEQAILRDSYFLQSSIHTVQPMVDEESIPKGIDVVLRERDLWTNESPRDVKKVWKYKYKVSWKVYLSDMALMKGKPPQRPTQKQETEYLGTTKVKHAVTANEYLEVRATDNVEPSESQRTSGFNVA
ncbi:hypothetical protein HOY82DRAFT_604879 [Tuber indicum]|nr:hypothetical protein HOY82DRAFT_604879 [Tuber indicum]